MENKKPNALKLRMKQKRKKPEFLAQNWFRFPSLGKKWRAPIGKRNKLRKHIKAKGFLPKAGYGSPSAVRGFHPSGFEEIRVFNLSDLQKINPQKQCARIAAGVGNRKKTEMVKKAGELKIRVLNPGAAKAEKKQQNKN